MKFNAANLYFLWLDMIHYNRDISFVVARSEATTTSWIYFIDCYLKQAINFCHAVTVHFKVRLDKKVEISQFKYVIIYFGAVASG